MVSGTEKDALFVLGGLAVVVFFILRQRRSDRFRERSMLFPIALGYAIAWSPDGKLLALAGPAGPTWGDVSVVNPDGSGLRRIARCRCGLRGPGSSQSVAWSSDGTRIAYISARGNTVSTIRPDGSAAAVVATRAARGLTGYWYPSLPLWRPTP